MRFDLDADVPVHWVADSKFMTHFYNALSVVFPEGEKFFVRSVRQYEDRITDPELREQVRGFCAQEGHHTFQHRELNARVAQHGLSTARWDRWVKGYLRFVWAILWPKARLALTCALEHYTAVMGNQLLAYPEQQAPVHPRMLPLWLWHAVEETEHKAVAYDVYEHVGGGYVTRVLLQLMASLTFFPIVHGIQMRLMLEDRSAPTRLRDIWRGIYFLWGKPGGLRRMLPELFSYFRPGFHPWDNDNRELIDQWKRSQGAIDHIRG